MHMCMCPLNVVAAPLLFNMSALKRFASVSLHLSFYGMICINKYIIFKYILNNDSYQIAFHVYVFVLNKHASDVV